MPQVPRQQTHVSTVDCSEPDEQAGMVFRIIPWLRETGAVQDIRIVWGCHAYTDMSKRGEVMVPVIVRLFIRTDVRSSRPVRCWKDQ